MKEKLLKYSVVFLIFIFCSTSIYFSALSRDGSIDGWIGQVASTASTLEDQFYDFRMRQARDKKAKDDKIVLAYIDDLSLEKIGRWPWTRTVWVKVMDRLKHFGAKVVAFDIFFSEPENACNAESPDIALARELAKFQLDGQSHVVLPYTLGGLNDPLLEEVPGHLYNFMVHSEVRSSGEEDLDPNAEVAEGADALEEQIKPAIMEAKLNRTTFPLPPLIEAEPSLGFVNTYPDEDGVFRHFPVVASVDTLIFPSLALIAYEKFTGDKSKIEVDQFGTPTFTIKSGSIKLNHQGETKVRYFGAKGQFGGMSIIDLLNKPLDDAKTHELFNNKLVFVATVAIGAHDLRNTPVDPQAPGVYVHMNLAHMLLEGYYFKDFGSSFMYSLIFLLLGFFIMLVTQLKDSPILDILVIFVLIAGSYLIDIYYFLPEGYEIRLVFCYLAFLGSYSWVTLLNFQKASTDKKMIKGAFQNMIAPSIVDEMLKNPDKLQLGGEKKDITVMFSDVRDFTTISEKLTPEQLSYALNIYMTKMTNILIDGGGTLDKYIGDAIVGYWGAPVEDENHAYKALLGTKKMIEALPEVNEVNERENLPILKHGIGLNSGVCSVGNMGSDRIFSYTALGDNMNLGARIEGLCKFYGAELMCSEFTIAKLTEEQKKEFTIRKLDMVRVKGKEKAVTIFEIFHSFHHLADDPQALDDYHKMFDLYVKQEFKAALEIAKIYREKYPQDRPFEIMEGNIEQYIKLPPPPEWDGVTTYKTK